MKVIKKIQFQNEEIASIRLVQQIMLQACTELGNSSCAQCPFFYQENVDGAHGCIEDLLEKAIEKMENAE